MKFSTKTRYALRLMVDIVNSECDGYISLRDISERQGISVKYLEQIVAQLVKARLLKSSRGSQGGYKLSRSASEYTPGDVIRAVDGNIAVVACLVDDSNACQLAQSCSTVGFWRGMNTTLNTYIDSITLKEMADSQQKGT